jgi:predicted RND superfamily exporter protein
MFDRSDPALVPYRRMARAFGSSEAVLAVYDDPQLFTPPGIARLRALTAQLDDMPGVASATSLATVLGDRIIDLEESPLARKVVALMEGYAVGPDRRTAAVVCVLEPPAASVRTPRDHAVSRADTIDRLRATMADLPSGMVAGEPVMLRDGFAMLERDGNLLGTTSGLLAGAVLLLAFRSPRWLAIPLAVVLVALWTTRGMLAVVGLRLTMVSTMLSAMVTVVGIATVTHVIVEFRRQRGLGLAPRAALEESLTLLFWPVLGAIATDVIGFGSLIASRVGPVHDFGVMTAGARRPARCRPAHGLGGGAARNRPRPARGPDRGPAAADPARRDARRGGRDGGHVAARGGDRLHAELPPLEPGRGRLRDGRIPARRGRCLGRARAGARR